MCLLLTPPEQSYGSVSESEAIALSCHHILCGPEKSPGPVIASSLRLLGLAVQPSGGPDLGFAVRLLSLGFGPGEHRVAVETSTEPIDDHRMIVELLMGPELTYPLTIDEGSCVLLVDGVAVEFRTLFIEEDFWSGVALVDGRWVYVRGMGVATPDITIVSMDV